MASLPSYHEATTRPHWVTIVAPYVPARELTRLCLVDKRFHAEFAPRIWKDPFKTTRLLGLDPADDTERLKCLLTKHAGNMRLGTRSLVLSLDFRQLDLTSYQFLDHNIWNGADQKEKSSRIASAFPQLRCILLDGAPDRLAACIANDIEKDTGSSISLACLMFSAPKAATIFRSAFFSSPHVRSLVYVDLSHGHGSLNWALLATSLQCLRILKVRGREIDDATALALLSAFKRQLWSLDISHNKLTKAFLDDAVQSSFPEGSLRSAAYRDVEGRLELVDGAGSSWYGRFGFVDESQHSSKFTHPSRYLADPPVYSRDAETIPQEHTHARHNGTRPIRQDSAASVKRCLIGKPHQLPGAQLDAAGHDICASHGGITHLQLNGNVFYLHDVEKLIRESSGHLESLECDSNLLDIPGWASQGLPRWFRDASVIGFIGSSHLLRPVFSPHLQVLRIHHSLVTQIPSIRHDTLSVGESLWVAETILAPQIAMAFPQVLEPDMNPRLYSLTLTDVPRVSSGPLLRGILRFLRQASVQERAIQETNAAHSHRTSATLKGLRHLHLEFGPDPREAAPDTLDLEHLDATELLGPKDEEFSFFGRSGWASSSTTTDRQTREGEQTQKNDGNACQDETSLFLSPNPPPYRSGYAETADEFEEYRSEWNGQTFTVPVWVTSGVPGPHPAVNEYMRLLKMEGLRTKVGPASPSQVLAGVPPGSYLYHAAWDAIMVPPTVRNPTAAELGEMHDVVAAIKAYRAKTKAALSVAQKTARKLDVPSGEPHHHWGGKLEISFASVSHDPGMWR